MLPSYALLERQNEHQTNASSQQDEEPPAVGPSLRGQIKKWLSPANTGSIKLTRHDNANVQCVRAELISAPRSQVLFFFKHPDGAWRVFPPRPSHPTMRFWAAAANGSFVGS